MTLGAALRAAQQRVGRMDGRWLVQHVTAASDADLIARAEQELGERQMAQLEALLQRRLAGEPLAYLLGWTEFYGRRFAVSPAVLVPRPETEELVALALQKVAGLAAPAILDLGTGSGAIAVSLQCEYPPARCVAVDVSEAALSVARENARAANAVVEFRAGSWYAPLAAEERFDLVVSNPPYIAAGDTHLHGDGLRFEPAHALTDGADGLECIRAIIAGAPGHLCAGGWLLFEHGYDQGVASRNLLEAAGFEAVFTHRDLSGHDRISGGHLFF